MDNINGKNLIQNTTPIVCEECGHNVFTPAFFLRKVSRLLIGAQEDGIMPIQFGFACAKCGHINSDFKPEGLDENSEGEKKDEEKKSDLIIL